MAKQTVLKKFLFVVVLPLAIVLGATAYMVAGMILQRAPSERPLPISRADEPATVEAAAPQAFSEVREVPQPMPSDGNPSSTSPEPKANQDRKKNLKHQPVSELEPKTGDQSQLDQSSLQLVTGPIKKIFADLF